MAFPIPNGVVKALVDVCVDADVMESRPVAAAAAAAAISGAFPAVIASR